MGCDIHFCVERYTADGWQRVEAMRPHSWRDGETERVEWYDGRSYHLFAMLADVRNGMGVAGIRTGDGFTPIADPKGLPEDAAAETRSESDRWGIDGHSHSWLNVRELLAYDWEQTTKRAACVKDVDDRHPEGGAAAEAARFASEFGHLPSWAQGGRPLHPGPEWHQFDYEVTYAQCVPDDFWSCLARMARLAITAHGGELEHVRCVFWFDN